MFTMSALVQSGQWGRARSLLEVMKADGMPPKVGCYSHLLTLLHTRCVGGKDRNKNRIESFLPHVMIVGDFNILMHEKKGTEGQF